MPVTQADLTAFLNVSAKEAVGLLQRSAAPADTSFAGGYPTLPTSLEWPRDPNGNECIFLAQFDLAELPTRPSGWPETGFIFIFLNAVLEDCKDAATSKPFLYYATANQTFETRKPSSAIHAKSYFWYEGDGNPTFARGDGISLELDALPKTGWNFTPFTDYNVPLDYAEPNDFAALLTAAERVAFEEIDIKPEVLLGLVSECAAEHRNQLMQQPELPPRNGGFELIDPGFKLRDTWWGRSETYAKTNVPLHPYFADFPHAASVIFHHAKSISFSGAYGADQDNVVDDLAVRIAAEATDWMRWAGENKDAPVPEQTRQEYRAWCQRCYAQCFEAARPGVFDPPRVWKKFLSLRRRLYNMLPVARREKRKLVVSSHSRRFKEIEKLYDAIAHVKQPQEQGALLGQLFGYGEDIQDEASLHRGKTLVFQSAGLPNISFGDGDFKLWLEGTELKANAWQRVIAVNAVT